MRCREWLDFIRVLWLFRARKRFIYSYLWLRLYYLLDNPFQVSKRYLHARKETDLYQYGETPVTLFASLLSEAEVDSDDHLFELGAGSGYCSLWAASYLGIRVTAIEQVPVFCHRLAKVKKRFGLDNLIIRENSYLVEDLQPASLIYIYASNLEDKVIVDLAERLAQLPAGVKVMSVSYAIADYCEKGCFSVEKVLTGHFPWGEADVYLQVRASDTPTSAD